MPPRPAAWWRSPSSPLLSCWWCWWPFSAPWTPSATAPGMPATEPWGSRRWCTGPSSGGTGPAAPGTAAGEIPRPPEVPGRPAAPAALARDLVLPWAEDPDRPGAAASAAAGEEASAEAGAGVLAAAEAAALAEAAAAASVGAGAEALEAAAAEALAVEAEAAASAAGAELHIFERTSGIPCRVPGVMLIAQFLDRKQEKLPQNHLLTAEEIYRTLRTTQNLSKGSEEKSRRRKKPQRARVVEKGAESFAEHGLGAAHRQRRDIRLGRDGSARYSAGVCWYPLRPTP